MRWFVSGLLLAVPAWSVPAAADDDKIEPGFTPLFNGKNLDGWKTKSGGELLDGKTEAYKGRFKVRSGLLVIDPKVKGDVTIDTVKKFKDVHIKFEFLPGPRCNNDLFIRGLKFDLVKGNVKNLKERVACHLRDQLESTRPTVDRIAQKISGHFDVKIRHLQSDQRFRQVVWPRQVGMYLARQLTNWAATGSENV